jgi:hypothetical protein
MKKRLGRPPAGRQTMTATERQRRWRNKVRKARTELQRDADTAGTLRFSYHARLPTTDATEFWFAERDGWAFVVAHDKTGGGYCVSYRNMRFPIADTVANAAAIFFHGDDELRGVEEAPERFGHASLDEAQRACEEKFRELCKAGHG